MEKSVLCRLMLSWPDRNWPEKEAGGARRHSPSINVEHVIMIERETANKRRRGVDNVDYVCTTTTNVCR